MNAARRTLESKIDDLLLDPALKDAGSFIAIIPSTPQKILCLGTKEELLEGMQSGFWKSRDRPVKVMTASGGSAT